MRGGKIKLTDFGLAKSLETASTLSLTGTILGTPLYMSPEQADGKQIDARSDLYSLGATFYHALTGRPPFEGPTPVAIVLKHVKETLQPAHEVNPAVPVGISNVLSRMLAKKPEDRYLSAEAVLADLEGLDRGRIPAAPARAVQAAPTRWNRKQILAAGGAAAACLIAAFAIGAMASRNGDPVKPVAPEPAIDTSEDARVEAPPPPPPPATAVAKEPARPPAPPPDSKVIVAPLTIEQAGAAIDSSIPQQPPDPPPPSLETPPPPPRTGRRGPLRGEDGFRPRPGGGRGDGMMDSIRKLPREPEPGTREALKAARESLKKSEPMAAVTVLRASRRMHADYIDEHPDVKSEYEKLTREAMSKIPPALRRQLDEARGRFGRGRGGPPSPPSPP